MINIFKNENTLQVIAQYSVYKAVNTTINLLVWGYYFILLYKRTNSIEFLLADYLIFILTLYIGFVVTSFFLDRLGYLRVYRIIFASNAMLLIFILLSLNQFENFFILIALIRGLIHGAYWTVDDSITLNDTRGDARSKFLSGIQSLELLLGIVVPVLGGALISFTGNYEATFILGAAVAIAGIYMPFTFNKKGESSLTSKEINKILKHKAAPAYFFIAFLEGGSGILQDVTFKIIPFILIGEEFGVGVLMSIVGFAAVILAWVDRGFSEKLKIQLGYIGYVAFTISTMAFAIIWTIPALVIRSLILSFTNSVGMPARIQLDYKTREKILGINTSSSTLEFNLLTNTAYLFARIFFLSLTLILFSIIGVNNTNLMESMLKLVVFCVAPIRLLNYALYHYMSRTV